MAQSVTSKQSPKSVARFARRHQRLTRRTKNGDAIAIAARLDGPVADLELKIKSVQDAEQAVEDAFDDWYADDAVVDAHVHGLARKTKDYDADNAGSRTYATIFQDKAPSEITRMNRAAQPDEVVKLIQRIAAVPADHPAVAIAPELAATNEQARASHTAYMQAQTALVSAKADAELVKMSVVQLYRDNIIDMARAVGETLTERCFPQVRRPAKKKNED